MLDLGRHWLLSLAMIGPFATVNDAASDSLGDNVCGPRCVRYILSQFGQDIELIDLVKEMQWPAMENGVSVQGLQQTLERRGIFVKAIWVRDVELIRSPYPAIVRVERVDGEGHFLVLNSMSNDSGKYWDGLSGSCNHIPSSMKPTGEVLLTSPNAITDVGSLFESHHRLSRVMYAIMIAVLIYFALPTAKQMVVKRRAQHR